MSRAMMIFFGPLVVCFVIRMPVAIGMIVSLTPYPVAEGMDSSVVMEIFTSKMYNNFILLAVPLFIFAANIMGSSKVTNKIFDFSKILVGRWKGGLGYTNVIAPLIFSGITGSVVANTSGLGIMEIEAMRKEGYDGGFNAAITAGSVTIGPISPPSIPLVVYGVIVDVSIGNLLLAGMVPGIILALALCTYVCYTANKRSYPSGRKYAGMEFTKMTVSAIPAFLTSIILLMGIYTGIMIATEAGAVAALHALLIPVFVYRSITLLEFIQVLRNTVKSTGQIGITLSATYMFSYVIAVENLPSPAGNPILSFAITKVSFLALANILLSMLGMLLDSAVLQLVLLPILCPIAQSSGIDMTHFGVVFTLDTMIGLCIPPLGMLLFTVTRVSGEKASTIIKEAMPMAFVMVLVLIPATLVPDVTMQLPRLFGR